MRFFVEILGNHALWTALLGWFVAQLLKVITVLIRDKRFDVRRFVGSGGMPSSHSSFVMALATFIGLAQGFDSAMFALSMVFAFVVMYDAAGVRRAAGKQAAVLNQMIEHWDDAPEIQGERLKELLGHTPYEVLAGAILGIVLAIFMYYKVF
ncbi:MAG: divergent PAP2 family protein [Clostridia bacterium]|nr:divergent PAP2 family protein [Clostridia bacterium]